MAAGQAVWGIEVGRCALKAIKLRQTSEGGVEIVAHDYIEHAKILSQPDAEPHELIAAALEKFLSKNDVSKDAVVIGVPGQHTLARFTKLPPVAPKRIPDIVRYEADQQIPFDMDEVIWDYQTFQEDDLPDIEVGIFAMKRELLREHLLHFEQASIEPIIVQSGPLAVYNAAHYDGWLSDATTIVVDVGASNADLVISTKNSFWTRTIPIGGNSFTEALVKSFKLSFSKAESLKRSADTSKYRRQIFQAMRPVFADLVQELQRSIGFYSSTHREAKINKVVCVGNAFKLSGLKKYLQQNLGMDVEQPSHFSKVSGSSKGEALKDEFLSFPVVFGLALQGLDVASVQNNLLPTEMAKQAVWRRKRPAFAAAAACLVLVGGSVWFRQTADMSALASTAGPGANVSSVDDALNIIERGPAAGLSPRGQAEAVKAAGQKLKQELGRLKGEGATERAQSETLVRLQQNKTMVPRILQVIHGAIPHDSGALGKAGSQAEVLEALKAGAPPRNKRSKLAITEFDMWYEPDVHVYAWEGLLEPEDPINDVGTEVPGIVVKIICTTPNEDAVNFVGKNFIDKLKADGRQPGMGFYFDRVVVFRGNKVELTKSTPGRRGGGRTAVWTGEADDAESEEDVPAQHRDCVTCEPIKDDWEFEIYLDVILEDYPEDAGEG